MLCMLPGCSDHNSINFKKDYESLNGKVNKAGKEHRSLDIAKDNPFIFAKNNLLYALPKLCSYPVMRL